MSEKETAYGDARKAKGAVQIERLSDGWEVRVIMDGWAAMAWGHTPSEAAEEICRGAPALLASEAFRGSLLDFLSRHQSGDGGLPPGSMTIKERRAGLVGRDGGA